MPDAAQADSLIDDEGALIRWMGERGKVSIEGGRELWLGGTRLKAGWFVRWFRDDEQYSQAEGETLIETLRSAVDDG
jgi:hypothetical protein